LLGGDDHQGNAMASQPRGPAGETYRSMVTDTCYKSGNLKSIQLVVISYSKI